MTVAHDATLAEARRQMEQLHCRHLPVLKESRIVGMLTRHALDQVAALAHNELTRLIASDAMSEALVVEGATPLGDVLTQMIERPVDAAVVIASGRVVGIFTTVDAVKLLRHVLESRQQR